MAEGAGGRGGAAVAFPPLTVAEGLLVDVHQPAVRGVLVGYDSNSVRMCGGARWVGVGGEELTRKVILRPVKKFAHHGARDAQVNTNCL